MYAHNVHRDDYQDLARDMLGLLGHRPGDPQDERAPRPRRGPRHRLRTGDQREDPQGAGPERHRGQPLHHRRRQGGHRRQERRQVRRRRRPRAGSTAAGPCRAAAAAAVEGGHRLFGFFGSKALNHLPYRTADGRYDPAPDLDGKAESYTPADLTEQPTLADMTRAALTVLGARPEQPFALFVEAGDVDFALHNNNLDNAIGAVYQRRGGDPRHHRLGRGAQQLGRVGPDRHRRPRPLPRPRRSKGAD